jgi:hypothetical protein
MGTGMKTKIVTTVFAAATSVLSLMLTPAKSAVQPHLLYATSGAGTELVAFNLEERTTRTIGGIGIPFSLSLAFCPPGGLVPYTMTNTFGSAQLATINLETGAATPIGLPLGQQLNIMGMTCSREGTLYALGDSDPADRDFNSLYTVNRESGLATRIGATGVQLSTEEDPFFGFFMALAFAPDGTLYGANDIALYRINPSTGYATKIVDFAGVTQPPSVMGLAIDSLGNFYVADFVPMPPGSRVYRVDTSSGEATPILNTGLGYVHNIAFRVPF